MIWFTVEKLGLFFRKTIPCASRRTRLLSLFIALFLLFSAPLPAGAADTYTGIPKPENLLAAINFRDVKGSWAKEAIYRAAAQGLMQGSNGYFKPNSTVTKEQAITILVSLKGLDAEAQQAAADAAAAGKKWRDLSEYWGNGYISVAVKEGIIAPEEQQALENSRRNPATREEVAAWCGRCMDLDPAYGAQQQRLLSLTDWRSIKPVYMGMVAAVINEGIMVGSTGGAFQPKKAVTRGEMAVLADKVSVRMAEDRNLEFREGYIAKRDEIWVGTNSGIVKEISYTVKDAAGQPFVLTAREVPGNSISPKQGFVVYKNGSLGTHGVLKAGDNVKAILTGDKKVLFVQVGGTKAGSLNGIFAGLGPDDKTINIVDSSGKTVAYPLKAQASVSINNQAATVRDLIHGQEVSLSLSGGSVSAIKGFTSNSSTIYSYSMPTRQVIEGQVSYVSSNGRELTLNVNGNRKTLSLDSFTKIVRDGASVPASRIHVGDRVMAYLETGSSGSYVSQIQVSGSNNSSGTVYKGYAQAVYPVDGKVVMRDVQEYFFGGWFPYGNTLTINVTPGAPVYLDGEAVDLGWLSKAGIGLKLYAAVTDNGSGVRALKLAAHSGPGEMFNGDVEEVDWSASAIELKDVSGTFGPGTIVLHDGKFIEAADIEEDENVFVETSLLDGDHLLAFIAWEGSYLPDYQIARGRLEEVDGDSFELDDYREFEDHVWEDDDSSETLDLSPEAYIVDARDRSNPKTVSVKDFRYSEYSEEFNDDFIVTVGQDGMVEGIIILEEGFSGDKTSVARISAVNGSRITLERQMDWSQGTKQWKENRFPATLDAGCALVYKDHERVGRGMLHVGDKVYIIHNGNSAYIVFIQ